MHGSELKRKIGRFYDDYHKWRLRAPDSYQLGKVWSHFHGNVLEIGAGRWFWTAPPGMSYFVADISIEAMRQAVKEGIAAVVGDGETLPFKSKQFSTAACHDVLEHIVDPGTFIREMCRVSNYRVVIAGPNYVGTEPGGGLDRLLPLRLFRFLFGPGRSCHPLSQPHLSYDEMWQPDADAVTAANALWVANLLREQGFDVRVSETWTRGLKHLNRFPAIRYLGSFMVIVAVRAQERALQCR